MKLQSLIQSLRKFRSLHHWVGISAVAFLFVTAFTGILLGWKKHNATLQPPTQKGSSSNLSEWVSFDRVVAAAHHALDSVAHVSSEVEKLDVRIDKGVIKVIYLNYWEVQVDGKTAKALSVAKRPSDWIEHIHDGSIISDNFKLLYTNYTGLSLLILSITGFWLWFGPRKIRSEKTKKSL
ncbi:MAG: PepSY domain-containing protein [Cyclobacteriaceae bacterium]|nr:PepSY domain-containing protein [Cyclobacteriaceae bacterium]